MYSKSVRRTAVSFLNQFQYPKRLSHEAKPLSLMSLSSEPSFLSAIISMIVIRFLAFDKAVKLVNDLNDVAISTPVTSLFYRDN